MRENPLQDREFSELVPEPNQLETWKAIAPWSQIYSIDKSGEQNDRCIVYITIGYVEHYLNIGFDHSLFFLLFTLIFQYSIS